MLQGLPNLGPLKNYVELATGLTEVTANKAKEAAMALIAQGMSLGSKQPADVAATVQQAADDLVALSKTNRDMLIDLIRGEVDKAVGRMGFVREDELAALRSRVEKLEKQISAQTQGSAATEVQAVATESGTPTGSGTPTESSDDKKTAAPKKKKVIVSE